MPAQPIVIGLIGAGFAASFHVENYRRVPGLDRNVLLPDAERGRPRPRRARRDGATHRTLPTPILP